MDASFHRVKSVKLKPIRELPTGSFCRDIIITIKDGEQHEITLFSDDSKAISFIPPKPDSKQD